MRPSIVARAFLIILLVMLSAVSVGLFLDFFWIMAVGGMFIAVNITLFFYEHHQSIEKIAAKELFKVLEPLERSKVVRYIKAPLAPIKNILAPAPKPVKIVKAPLTQGKPAKFYDYWFLTGEKTKPNVKNILPPPRFRKSSSRDRLFSFLPAPEIPKKSGRVFAAATKPWHISKALVRMTIGQFVKRKPPALATISGGSKRIRKRGIRVKAKKVRKVKMLVWKGEGRGRRGAGATGRRKKNRHPQSALRNPARGRKGR